MMEGSESQSEVLELLREQNRLLKSLLLMALYSMRSERLFCEQLSYNLLFRWFLDMDMVGEGLDHSTFSKNRERLLAHEVAGRFFSEVVGLARKEKLLINPAYNYAA